MGDAPLPEDLLNAGIFVKTDQETGTSVKVRMVSLELAQKLRQSVEGDEATTPIQNCLLGAMRMMKKIGHT